MVPNARQRNPLPTLVYASLSVAVVASLGILLVPTIAREFNVPVSAAQWSLTINLLVGAVLTPVLGRLSDGPYKRRVLLVALAIILLGSVVAALAPNLPVYLAGRALQGLSFGVIPVSIALVRRYLPEDKVTPGISVIAITGAIGIGIGLPLTGVITGLFDYRWAFWFAVVFLSLAILFVLRSVPGQKDDTARRAKFDFPGALLLGIGLGSVLIAISQGPIWGWASPTTLGVLLFGLLVLGTWVAVELKTKYPLVNLRVLKIGEVLVANATSLGLGSVLYISVSMNSVIAQAPISSGYGLALPVFWAGFLQAPQSFGSFASNRALSRLTAKLHLTALLTIGVGTITAAAVFLLFFHSMLWQLLVGSLFIGLGLGAALGAMPSIIARAVAPSEVGSAVGFNQVLNTVGGSIGSAIAGSILAANTLPGLLPSSAGINSTLLIAACGCIIFLLASIANQWRRRRTPRPS